MKIKYNIICISILLELLKMDILWTHNINTVNTNILIKYLEITAFSDGSIRFRYISKQIYEFVEKEQFFTFDIHKLELNFTDIEGSELITSIKYKDSELEFGDYWSKGIVYFLSNE
jgi:hypothetical protein